MVTRVPRVQRENAGEFLPSEFRDYAPHAEQDGDRFRFVVDGRGGFWHRGSPAARQIALPSANCSRRPEPWPGRWPPAVCSILAGLSSACRCPALIQMKLMSE